MTTEQESSELGPAVSPTSARRHVGWYIVALGVAFLCYSVVAMSAEIGPAMREAQAFGIAQPFTHVDPYTADWLEDVQGGNWGRHGWSLMPAETGSVHIRLPGEAAGDLQLRLWTYDPGVLDIRVLETASGAVHRVEHSDSGIQSLRLGAGTCDLVIAAENRSDRQQVVLDHLYAYRSPAESTMPPLWRLGLGGVLVLAGLAACVIQGRSWATWRLWSGAVGIGAAVAAGLNARWTLLGLARGFTLDPDVAAFVRFSRQLDWFSDTHGFYSASFGIREPLHVAALSVWCQFWGDEYGMPRFYTVVLSTVLIAVIGILAWRLFQRPWAGIASAWIMALNPVLIDESVRGLRLEAIILLLVAALWCWLWTNGLLGALALGILLGVGSLLNMQNASIMLGPIWLAWLLNRFSHRLGRRFAPVHWGFRHLLVCTVTCVALVSPHFMGMKRAHGDHTWPAQVYARWQAYLEFPEQFATAEFPDAASYAYGGPPYSILQYFWELHSLPQLFAGQIRGWAESSAIMTASIGTTVKSGVYVGGVRALWQHVGVGHLLVISMALALTGVGWVILWANPRLWYVSFISLWGTWYMAYMFSERLTEWFRHTGHVYPFLVFCMIGGGQWLRAQWISRRGVRTD